MTLMELIDAYAFQREDTSMYSGACIEARTAVVEAVEKLEAEVFRLREHIIDQTKLEAENAKLKEALNFYAAKTNYKYWVANDGDGRFDVTDSEVTLDEGETARAALGEK